MKNVVVVDYGIGNVFSVCQALTMAGVEPQLTGDHRQISNASKVVLPGVGAFGKASEALGARGLTDVLRDYVADGGHFLGICVGMQLMFDTGHEYGTHSGLGLVPGTVEKISASDQGGRSLPIPFIGWAGLRTHEASINSIVPLATLENHKFYFVHSFAGVPKKTTSLLATVEYGDRQIAAAVQVNNAIGVQFHPEKSGKSGLALLQTFLKASH